MLELWNLLCRDYRKKIVKYVILVAGRPLYHKKALSRQP